MGGIFSPHVGFHPRVRRRTRIRTPSSSVSLEFPKDFCFQLFRFFAGGLSGPGSDSILHRLAPLTTLAVFRAQTHVIC